MKPLVKASTAFDRIISLFAFLAAALIILVMLAICYEIVLRSFLNRPQVWVLEYTQYGLVFICFLAATWVLRQEGHVKMDLVVGRLNPRARSILNIITSILGMMVCLGFTCFGVIATQGYYESGFSSPTVLETPEWIILIIIPIGCFLLVIQFIRRIHGHLGELRESHRLKQEI
ncbi:TRAP transporter small permease subunit [Chloroflexota bacterium]